MDESCLIEGILKERFSEHVISVSGNERKSVLKTADDPRMIKISRGSAKLYDIAYFQSLQPRFFGKRPDALVLNKKVIKVFYASPGRSAILKRSVIPTENGGKIHNAASCENALGNKVCAIAAQSVKIVKSRVSSVSPFARIKYRFYAVVFNYFHVFIVCGSAFVCLVYGSVSRLIGKSFQFMYRMLQTMRTEKKTLFQMGQKVKIGCNKKIWSNIV